MSAWKKSTEADDDVGSQLSSERALSQDESKDVEADREWPGTGEVASVMLAICLAVFLGALVRASAHRSGSGCPPLTTDAGPNDHCYGDSEDHGRV